MQLVKRGILTNRNNTVEDKARRELAANKRENIIESFHNVLFTLGLPLGILG
jgi:hypothetical protein